MNLDPIAAIYLNTAKNALARMLDPLVSLMEGYLAESPPNLNETRSIMRAFLSLLMTLEREEQKQAMCFLSATHPGLMARLNQCTDQIDQANRKRMEDPRERPAQS